MMHHTISNGIFCVGISVGGTVVWGRLVISREGSGAGVGGGVGGVVRGGVCVVTASMETASCFTFWSPRCTRRVSVLADVGFSTRTENVRMAVFAEVRNSTIAVPELSVVTSA